MERIEFIKDKDIKVKIAAKILNDLPEWFGLPESVNEYIENSKEMPFWAVYIENSPVGFIALKETSIYTAEIYVMGILKEFQHKGFGKKLYQTFKLYAQNNNYEFLQVKTVDEGKYEEYDKTRLFYELMGFKKLECFPMLWDEDNPCLIMICTV